MLDYLRGTVCLGEKERDFIYPVMDHCERYRCYDDIFINDDQEVQTSPSPHPNTSSFGDNHESIIQRPTSRLEKTKGDRSYVNTGVKGSNNKNRCVVQELTEHQLLLLHPKAHVYDLNLKEWSEYPPSFCIFP